MNNTPNNIESLLKQFRSTVEIPSRTEFSSLINSVTNESFNRNTSLKGIKSPFISFMNFTKNKLVLVGSVALLALIIIIPTVRHQRITAVPIKDSQTQIAVSADEQSTMVIQESKGTVSEDIIADIMNEFNQEDALIAQELADDGYIQNDYQIDESFIS